MDRGTGGREFELQPRLHPMGDPEDVVDAFGEFRHGRLVVLGVIETEAAEACPGTQG